VSGGWFERQRQLWIAEMLNVYGFINREHLQRKFSISQPQASLDLQRFLRTNPGDLFYDLSRKCYVAAQKRKRA
jgi:hypothetical protein